MVTNNELQRSFDTLSSQFSQFQNIMKDESMRTDQRFAEAAELSRIQDAQQRKMLFDMFHELNSKLSDLDSRLSKEDGSLESPASDKATSTGVAPTLSTFQK
jgi:hypothetical protein